jgi:hypothetical protein
MSDKNFIIYNAIDSLCAIDKKRLLKILTIINIHDNKYADNGLHTMREYIVLLGVDYKVRVYVLRGQREDGEMDVSLEINFEDTTISIATQNNFKKLGTVEVLLENRDTANNLTLILRKFINLFNGIGEQ